MMMERMEEARAKKQDCTVSQPAVSYLLGFIFVLLLFEAKAQITFCPPGAQWRYRFDQYQYWQVLNYQISYTGDSIVGGDTLKILSYNSFSRYSSLQQPPYIAFIKQHGDTIFVRSVWTNHQWQILYNYAAQPGQSWTNTINTYTCKTTVNLVDTVMLNTKPVRRLSVTYTDNSPGGTYQGYITEYIGSSDYLFNFRHKSSSDSPEYKEFLCYKDNSLGTIQFGTKPCNYSNLAGIKEQLAQSGFKVYPNPVSEELSIETMEGSQIIISDVNGKIVKQELLNENQTINASELKPGLYFLQIRQNNELVYKMKLLKD